MHITRIHFERPPAPPQVSAWQVVVPVVLLILLIAGVALAMAVPVGPPHVVPLID